jgi:hypothetical protein
MENLNQKGIDAWIANFHRNAAESEKNNTSIFCESFKDKRNLEKLVIELEKENNYLKNKLAELEKD